MSSKPVNALGSKPPVAAPIRFDEGIDWGSPEMVVYLVLAAQLLVAAVYGYFVLPESLPAARRRPMNWRAALNPLAALARLLRYVPGDYTDRAMYGRLRSALGAARAAYQAGESEPGTLERAMTAVIAAEPAATCDYAVVVDPETLRPITRAAPGSRALIAARVGAVRLIDNGPLQESGAAG